MNNKYKIAATIITITLIMFAIAPWMKNEQVKNIVLANKNFQSQHKTDFETISNQLQVTWIPFGRTITTYEGNWFVWFWQ